MKLCQQQDPLFLFSVVLLILTSQNCNFSFRFQVNSQKEKMGIYVSAQLYQQFAGK